MVTSDKVSYLYAIWIDEHTSKLYGLVEAGFFAHTYIRESSSQFISQTICPRVLWSSMNEAYRAARYHGQLPDNTSYRYYEFAYVMTNMHELRIVKPAEGRNRCISSVAMSHK